MSVKDEKESVEDSVYSLNFLAGYLSSNTEEEKEHVHQQAQPNAHNRQTISHQVHHRRLKDQASAAKE